MASQWALQVAPILADIVMNDLLDYVVDRLPFSCLFIFKYVDDLCLAVPCESIDVVNKIFNEYHNNLKFTFEVEDNGQLAFLDILLIRGSDNIKVDWWRKPNRSDRYLNFKSHHPLRQKVNSALALKYRALQLSDVEFHRKNLLIIKDLLLKNSFPIGLINNILYSSRFNKIDNRERLNEDTKYKSLIYVKALSEPLCNIFKRKDV